jgi:hypothetical protein
VALFFQSEILSAAAAASPGGSQGGAGVGSMPVALLTNDNGARGWLVCGAANLRTHSKPIPPHQNPNPQPTGQLQLAKSHGLPAFKITPNPTFDAAIAPLLAPTAASAAPLTSAALRALLAPAATSGVNAAPAGRGLQEEFDGAVACLRGLLGAYEDLGAALSDVTAAVFDEGRGAGEVVAALRALLGGRLHALPFSEGRGAAALSTPVRGGSMDSGGTGGGGVASGDGEEGGAVSSAAPAGAAGGTAAAYGPLLEAPKANVAALAARVQMWEGVVRTHQLPSRVVKWAM